MEAASEKRRGRPRVWSEDSLLILASFFGCANVSHRHKLNIAHMHTALRALVDVSPELPADGPFAWIACHKPPLLKKGVLAELGRLGEPELIREWALVVCQGRLKTKHAEVMIRQVRLGFAPDSAAGARTLYLLLAKTILGFIETHPTLSLAAVAKVLGDLGVAYRQADESH